MHLILGNRDINKMRLTAELDPANWQPADEHPGVYWRQRGGPNGAPYTPATFHEPSTNLLRTFHSGAPYTPATFLEELVAKGANGSDSPARKYHRSM